MNQPLHPKPLPHAAAPQAAGEDAAAPSEWKRTSQLLEDGLQDFTRVWLKGLPANIRPLKCAHYYPRVVNKMAALWSLEERCIDYLDELLADRRGERLGFGYGIPGELRLLRHHRAANRPEPEGDDPPTDFAPTVPMEIQPPPKR